MTFHKRFREFLKNKYPSWAESEAQAPLSDLLISPHKVQLPLSVLHQTQELVTSFTELAARPSYQKSIHTPHAELLEFNPGNHAILNSYDCHLNQDLTPKLIEINTNASGALIGEALTEFQDLPPPGFHVKLREAIHQELKLTGHSLTPHVAIIDENPQQQRLYVEFLFYRDLFANWGWPTVILDGSQLTLQNEGLETEQKARVDFIYNRETDFFLTGERLKQVREAYLKRQVCLSPNPHAYLLLADKMRLIEISREGFLENVAPDLKSTLERYIPRTLDIKDRDQMWSERKKYFFKPRNAYGSKAVYRGSSISKKTFTEVVGEDFIAQEYVQPQEVKFEGESFKYDLRFYTYHNQIQLVMARLYQGQLTNFNTEGGGFAAIEWV